MSLGDGVDAVEVSEDLTRPIKRVGFGVACYVRVGDGPEYRHAGLVEDAAAGRLWLAGERVRIIAVHPLAGEGAGGQ